MRKWIVLFIIMIVFSCDKDDSKKYSISIRNVSDFALYEISIVMQSLKTDLPNSFFIDSLSTEEETEKFTLCFDRTKSDGCGKAIGINLAAYFEISYSQNDSIKYMNIDIEGRESDYITAVVENDGFYVIDN